MKIPNKVKIGAHSYDIIFQDDVEEDGVFGTCRPRKLKIYIDDGVPKSQQEDTFFHEVLHAIFHQTGNSTPWNPEKEERIVMSVAHSFYQMLKENNLLK